MKVLVVQTAFLGDVVLTLPLISSVKKKFPDSLISTVVTEKTKDIPDSSPHNDEVIVYDKRGKDRGITGFLRILKIIKEKRFDIAVLPHRSLRSALLVCLAGIPKRIGFDISSGSFFLNRNVIYEKKKHDLERNLELLKPLGVESFEKKIILNVDDKESKYAKEMLKDKKLVIGVNPGSVWNTKRWLAERFAEVSDRLIKEKGATIILFGDKNDISVGEKIEKNMREKPMNLIGKTTLKQLIALIKECSLFITNDSGSMHIAVAMNVPVVAIFGPTVKEFGFYPYSERSLVIERDLPCRPCGKHGSKTCPEGHFDCMKQITAEDVYTKSLSLLIST